VAINLAARLCSAAGAGQVLLGENSARLAGHGADQDDAEIEFAARSPLSLKASTVVRTRAGLERVTERVTGIEPALSAWEADVLPLNYTRGRRFVADERGRG